MRRALRYLCAAAAIALSASGSLSAQEQSITIANAKVFGRLTRTPVVFPHQAHMAQDGLDCLSCHHRYEKSAGKKANVLDLATLAEGGGTVACASCHASKAGLQKAFHRLCIGCHDSAKRQGKVTGPRTCGECHRWEK